LFIRLLEYREHKGHITLNDTIHEAGQGPVELIDGLCGDGQAT